MKLFYIIYLFSTLIILSCGCSNYTRKEEFSGLSKWSKYEINQLNEELDLLNQKYESLSDKIKEPDLETPLELRITSLESKILLLEHELQVLKEFEEKSSRQQINKSGVEISPLNVADKKEFQKDLTIPDSYNDAVKILRTGEYEKGITALKQILSTGTDSSLEDNCNYWIGEGYLGLKDYENALKYFENVINFYPDGNKAPDAFLKFISTAVKLGLKDKVELNYKKMENRYPRSEYTKKALEILKNLEINH